jgi:hypothetical protein
MAGGRPGHPAPMTGALRPHGVPPEELSDDDLVREVTHLHDTRHEAMRGASEDAFEAHTRRMLALEQEYLRRFPEDAAPDPLRTRAGSRANAAEDAAAEDAAADPH